MEKSDLVVKSNGLIKASYTLGLVEQRLILMAIVSARNTKQGIDANTLLQVSAVDYAELFDVTRQTAFEVLTGAIETLFNRQATVQVYDLQRKRMRPLTVRWVTGMYHEKNTGIITLRFSHEVIPEITRLEGSFTSYQLKQVTGISSNYALRLYELLVQWKEVGQTPVFELDEFRAQIGLLDDQYMQMCHFKNRVLDFSVKQINEHSDIIIDYEQIKAGRVITGFTFIVKPKITKGSAKKKPPTKPKTSTTEAQLNWINNDILERFNSLSKERQKAIVADTETRLKGANQARFKAAKLSSIDRLIAEFAIEINESIMRTAALMM